MATDEIGWAGDDPWARCAAAGREGPGWHGSLALEFAQRDGATRLLRNRHEGPLRLLKALPSADGRALEAVIVHPPGGLVGGDRLSLRISAVAGAQVLVTTPGAQKWYRAARGARSETELSLQAARLEWLPQPAIVFDEARVAQHLAIRMDSASVCVGWEILVRGRTAMGEHWRHGDIEQSLSIVLDGRALWHERLAADAADRIFASPIGWKGRTVAATVWCCAPTLAPAPLASLRDAWHEAIAPIDGAATCAAGGLVLAKLLDDDVERVQDGCQRLWALARTLLDGTPGSAPRLWRT